MQPQWLVVGAFLASGLLIVALAVPLIRGRVPRNELYGFRTEKTLASDEIWYPANCFMGRELLMCGLVMTGGSLLLALAAPLLTMDALVLLELALTLVPLTVAMVRGFRYLQTL